MQEDQPAAAVRLCVIGTKNQAAAGLRCGVMLDVMLHAREHTHHRIAERSREVPRET